MKGYRIIPEALQAYCYLVKYFGFSNNWQAFVEWQDKFYLN